MVLKEIKMADHQPEVKGTRSGNNSEEEKNVVYIHKAKYVRYRKSSTSSSVSTVGTPI